MRININLFSQIVLILGFLSVLIIVVGAAEGKTLIVAKDGGDFDTIQSAVENATGGDTIRVYAGTYSENVQMDKPVNIIGNGSENTVLQGNGSGVVYLKHGRKRLSPGACLLCWTVHFQSPSSKGQSPQQSTVNLRWHRMIAIDCCEIRSTRKTLENTLVTRLRLVTHCSGGSASQ